ncbi:sugar 3,4-ketoisomerase [Echinimonas agarilytica]|uniref:FdtA/QdtA family cupin domain-containing protein n=1 Tax=Echinimonas agarilytica TaxID=1215918 RepID=A0AA41W6Y1_9GAMM|nr:FdtA/QdtA family cupin domain-containing protein [Echinimonas agarilytica]MCM2680127.1 FdtA/QdtA family cupin domain-containing protein [Echinimonas agarilytica]
MNVNLIQLQSHGDERGALVSLEQSLNIPFQIKRVYYVFNTKESVTRGFHAHKELKQLAIAVKGSCRFLLDDGKEKVDVLLDNPAQGLMIDSFIWREMTDFSEDCVLLVLADAYYDENDYIRDYDKFLGLISDE